MDTLFQVLKMLGCLGMFLYGMALMSGGLQKLAGDSMRTFLASMTSTRVKCVLTGIVVTALVQSSTATTLMLVSFVNAGLMALTNAIGVIMGANIGTTVTAWLFALSFDGSFSLGAIAIPLMALAFILLSQKRQKGRNFGEFIMGFALLFLCIMAVNFFFLAPLLARAFSQDDEIRAYMTMYLRIIPWGFWAIEIHRFSTFIFTGCSRPNFAAALNIVRVLAMLIPFTIIAFFWLHTLRAVFAARLFSDIAGGIMGFCCARHLTNRLVKTSPTNCHP